MAHIIQPMLAVIGDVFVAGFSAAADVPTPYAQNDAAHVRYMAKEGRYTNPGGYEANNAVDFSWNVEQLIPQIIDAPRLGEPSTFEPGLRYGVVSVTRDAATPSFTPQGATNGYTILRDAIELVRTDPIFKPDPADTVEPFLDFVFFSTGLSEPVTPGFDADDYRDALRLAITSIRSQSWAQHATFVLTLMPDQYRDTFGSSPDVIAARSIVEQVARELQGVRLFDLGSQNVPIGSSITPEVVGAFSREISEGLRSYRTTAGPPAGPDRNIGRRPTRSLYTGHTRFESEADALAFDDALVALGAPAERIEDPAHGGFGVRAGEGVHVPWGSVRTTRGVAAIEDENFVGQYITGVDVTAAQAGAGLEFRKSFTGANRRHLPVAGAGDPEMPGSALRIDWAGVCWYNGAGLRSLAGGLAEWEANYRPEVWSLGPSIATIDGSDPDFNDEPSLALGVTESVGGYVGLRRQTSWTFSTVFTGPAAVANPVSIVTMISGRSRFRSKIASLVIRYFATDTIIIEVATGNGGFRVWTYNVVAESKQFLTVTVDSEDPTRTALYSSGVVVPPTSTTLTIDDGSPAPDRLILGATNIDRQQYDGGGKVATCAAWRRVLSSAEISAVNTEFQSLYSGA